MSDIQRWKPSKSSINKIKMEVSERGKYIKYSDYLAETQRLQSIIKEMQQVDDVLSPRRKESEAIALVRKYLTENSTKLPDDFQKVLHDNLWDLYEGDDALSLQN